MKITKTQLIYIGIALFLLVLFFYPCSADGKTQFNGIRGCASGYDSALDAPDEVWKKEMKHGNFMGVTW